MGKIYFAENRFYLDMLTALNMSPLYPSWLNDVEVNKFLECRFVTHDTKSCVEYIQSCHAKGDKLFGIFDAKKNEHIGNIKICAFNAKHRRAQISLLIGEKKYWGKKIAREAMKKVLKYSFGDLNLVKLEAGCYEHNIASLRLFRSLGFEINGFLPSHFIDLEGNCLGCFWMSKVSEHNCMNGSVEE